MYICVCVLRVLGCVFRFGLVCVYVNSVCMCVYVYMCRMCLYICVCIFICGCVYVCVYVYVQILMFMFIIVCVQWCGCYVGIRQVGVGVWSGFLVGQKFSRRLFVGACFMVNYFQYYSLVLGRVLKCGFFCLSLGKQGFRGDGFYQFFSRQGLVILLSLYLRFLSFIVVCQYLGRRSSQRGWQM